MSVWKKWKLQDPLFLLANGLPSTSSFDALLNVQQDVVAALDQVCSRLTGDISAKCNALVQEYGPKIIEIILAEGPAAVCTGLGLCVGQKHLEGERFFIVIVNNFLNQNTYHWND